MRPPDPFIRQPSDVWVISTRLPTQRRDRLLHAPMYRDLVSELARSIQSVELLCERGKNDKTIRRVVATLIFAHARGVDAFHNSSSGYRAQYLSSPDLGDAANECAVQTMLPLVLNWVSLDTFSHARRQCAEASLGSRELKIWIRQGRWLRHAAGDCEDLMVPAWIARARDPDKLVRRRVRYGRQLPGETKALVIKGGWIGEDRQSIAAPPKPLLLRRMHLHCDGFT